VPRISESSQQASKGRAADAPITKPRWDCRIEATRTARFNPGPGRISLRHCNRRGMRARVLAMGDGAFGFCAALPEVFPQTKEQRCWFHNGGECSCCAAEVGSSGDDEGDAGHL